MYTDDNEGWYWRAWLSQGSSTLYWGVHDTHPFSKSGYLQNTPVTVGSSTTYTLCYNEGGSLDCPSHAAMVPNGFNSVLFRAWDYGMTAWAAEGSNNIKRVARHSNFIVFADGYSGFAKFSTDSTLGSYYKKDPANGYTMWFGHGKSSNMTFADGHVESRTVESLDDKNFSGIAK